tara:strand:- start:1033 stop:1461 length:429 start_codon:yes stop_codon:yes gene_type:complete
MRISNILLEKGSEVYVVDAESSILDASELLEKEKIGAVPVMNNKKVIGVLSERDIARGLAVFKNKISSLKVRDLMSKGELFTCDPEDTVDNCLSIMSGRRVRHLPVLEKGSLVGIVSIGDLVKIKMAEVEEEAKRLREYIYS